MVQRGTPRDQVFGAVDQPLAVEPHEDLAHGARQARVQREALALPVARDAERLELLDDARAVPGLPLPDLVDEVLAAEVVAGQAALGEILLDHHLRRDAGVIGAGHPQHVEAEQALVAREHVLERVVERVAEVQRTGHVRRRDHHREARRVAVFAGAEEAPLEPRAIETRLDGLRIESFGEFRRQGRRS